jgi:hypothetical protein
MRWPLAVIWVAVSVSVTVADTFVDHRSDAIGDSVMSRYDHEMNKCAKRALASDPDEIGGRISLSFDVLANGRTDNIKIAGGSLGMTSCLRARVQAWRFGASDEAEVTSVAFSLQVLPELAGRRDHRRIFRAVCADHVEEVQDCLADESPDDVLLELTLRQDGTVGRLTTLPRFAGQACLEQASRTWAFPRRPRASRVELDVARLLSCHGR